MLMIIMLQRVLLRFDAFSLEAAESDDDSCFDSVRVFDSATESSSDVIGTYCGSQTPPIVTSSGNSLIIVFSSDGSVGAAGFLASYTVKKIPSSPAASPVAVSAASAPGQCRHQSA